MRSLFTVHAGEYLVASEIERKFRRVNVWIPSKDTGVDLLITDCRSRRAVSLQVKFSKDFLVTKLQPVFQKDLRACGWWTIDAAKLQKSPADYWVFVLQGFANRSTDFVIVPPRDLARRLESIHGRQSKFQTYLWVSAKKRCWETRGLAKSDQLRVAGGDYENPSRDFTKWLNVWNAVSKLNTV